MSDIDVQTGFLSLAELASMNTDDIATLTSRVPAAGIYDTIGKLVRGKESEPKDGKPPLFRFSFQYEVAGAELVDKTIDPETLVGKVLTESYTLWPNDLVEGIGLLKGRYQKAGLPNQGMAMGGVEGQDPGWLDTMVSAPIRIRVRTAPDKSGELRAFFDWLKVEAPTTEVAA